METTNSNTSPALPVHTRLVDYLKEHSYGATFGALLEALQPYATADEAALALDQAVNEGVVRYLYRPEPAPAQGHCRTDLAFFLAEHLPLSRATEGDIDEVVSYFARREDYERMGGGPWVTLELAKVFEDFKPKMAVSFLAYALDTLRRESMLTFEARGKNRYVTVTLSAHRYYTVVALQTEPSALRSAPPTCSLRYFHVRAGSAEVACRKVAQVIPEDGTLEVQAVTENRIKYEAAPGKPAVTIETL